MAEKKVIELDVQNNLGSLKSQLKQAQAEVQTLSDKFGATSQAAAEAAKKAADLKDRIQDAKALTDAFNPDAKFTSLTRSIGGALDGFQAFEGALGLIGVESEDLQKTLLKVQSAMAFSQGIQGALEAKDSFIQLGSVVKNTFSAMTTASKAFLVGGIGLIIAAVGLIVANYDEWFGASKKVAEQQKVIAEQAKEQRQNIAKESGEFATLISRLKNTNEGSKERADLIKKINGQYGTTLKNIKDEAKFQESLNKELASYLEYQKAKYQLQKNEEFIVKNLEKQDLIQSKISKSTKDLPALIEAQKKAQKGLNETNAQDTNMVAFYAEKVREAKAAVEAKNKEIKLEQDELAKAEKRFNAYGSAANNAAAKVDKLTNSGTKYVEQTTEKVDKVEENEKKTIDLFTEGIDKLELLEKEKTKIVVGGEKERADGIKKELAGVEELRVRMWHREKELNALKKAQALEALDATANTLGKISELFGKQTKAGKAAAVAEATIQMFLSAQKAYASTVGIPVVGPVLAPINAALAIGVGLKNIKAITAVKVPNDTGGAPPPNTNTGGGGSSVISPNFNVVGNSGLNQLSQLQQKPTKAYVVSGDMTTAQSLDRNRIENATLVQ